MGTENSEMNDALDALESEHGSLDQNTDDLGDNENKEIIVDKEINGDGEPEKKEENNPPGYMGYDEWIAAGKDPDDFRGKKAYESQYETLKEVRELKGTMSQVVSGMDAWKDQQTKQMASHLEQEKATALADFEEAKESRDMDGALAAQDKLNKLNQTKPNQDSAATLNPIITDFFGKNPILDKSNAQFDSEFHDDMAMAQATLLNKLTGGDRTIQLTDKQIERSLKISFDTAKELHPDKFRSPRNNRLSSPNNRPRVPAKENAGNYSSRLKDVKGNSKNPRDTSSALDLYEIIKKSDPKAAETYAKNILGE